MGGSCSVQSGSDFVPIFKSLTIQAVLILTSGDFESSLLRTFCLLSS